MNRSWRSILFFDPSGPMMHYNVGLLTISDLNPENEIRWAMSRWEMAKLGFHCLVAAARRT